MKDLIWGSTSRSHIPSVRNTHGEACVVEVMVTITVNEAFLEENVTDTMCELESGSSELSKRSDNDSIEQDGFDKGD